MLKIQTVDDPIFGRDYIAATEPIKIGKHYWRMVAYRDSYHANSLYSGGVFLDYEWKEVPTPVYREYNLRPPRYIAAQEFSRFDTNHHNHGLPKSIRKLYDRNPETVALFDEERRKAVENLKQAA